MNNVALTLVFFHFVKILTGNINTYSEVENLLQPVIFASKIRIYPYSQYDRTVCLRAEVVGCIWNGKYCELYPFSRSFVSNSLQIVSNNLNEFLYPICKKNHKMTRMNVSTIFSLFFYLHFTPYDESSRVSTKSLKVTSALRLFIKFETKCNSYTMIYDNNNSKYLFVWRNK